ncbi:hypothetical protein AMTR_s00076p00051990 [Amborella trichopoda]|uniref:Uncharacterized protein n=1 Tax=Amborella trichopoda TaxID=13333 RepID=W1P9P5_AMBTC|nr:hypothetical protein AMTR_s00076p00051990 [Amborella trichopoda]
MKVPLIRKTSESSISRDLLKRDPFYPLQIGVEPEMSGVVQCSVVEVQEDEPESYELRPQGHLEPT